MDMTSIFSFQNFTQAHPYGLFTQEKTQSKKEKQSIEKFNKKFDGDPAKGKELLASCNAFASKDITCTLWGHICRVLGQQNQIPSIGRNHRYSQCVYRFVDSIHDKMSMILRTIRVYSLSNAKQIQSEFPLVCRSILENVNARQSDPKKICQSVVFLSIDGNEFYFAIPSDKKTVFPFNAFGESIDGRTSEKKDDDSIFPIDGDKTDYFTRFINPLSSEDETFYF